MSLVPARLTGRTGRCLAAERVPPNPAMHCARRSLGEEEAMS